MTDRATNRESITPSPRRQPPISSLLAQIRRAHAAALIRLVRLEPDREEEYRQRARHYGDLVRELERLTTERGDAQP